MARSTPNTELDLVPIMNLVTILIPFLLMAAAFTSVAVVDVAARSAGESSEPGEPEVRPKVLISGSGLQFVSVDGDTTELGCPGRCATTDDYALDGLKQALASHKASHPEGRALELIASDEVAYDVLIAVMDSSRSDGNEPLYPDVVFGSLPQEG